MEDGMEAARRAADRQTALRADAATLEHNSSSSTHNTCLMELLLRNRSLGSG